MLGGVGVVSDGGGLVVKSFVDWVVVGLLVCASLLTAVIHVPQHQTISPLDEYVYIDYLAKVPTQGVVRRGEMTGDYARNVAACRGFRFVASLPRELCGSVATSPDDAFPMGGTNSAYVYTPLYFAATWVMAQPLRWFGVNDLVTAGRATGWVWLAAAAVLLYLSLRRLKVRPFLGCGLCLLMVGSLGAYWGNTYISTDATAYFSGALMLWMLLRFLRRRYHGVGLLAAVAVVVTLLKFQNYGAVVVVAMFLLVYSGQEWGFVHGEGSWGRRFVRWVRDPRFSAAVIIAGVPLVAQAVWLVIQNLISIGPAENQGISSPLTIKALVSEAFNFFTGPIMSSADPQLGALIVLVLGSVSAWVIVSGVLGSAVVEERGSVGEALALSSFAVALLFGPALAIATRLSAGIYFDLPLRYGMSLVPFFIACAGLLYLRKQWVGGCVAVACIGCYALSLAITG